MSAGLTKTRLGGPSSRIFPTCYEADTGIDGPARGTAVHQVKASWHRACLQAHTVFTPTPRLGLAQIKGGSWIKTAETVSMSIVSSENKCGLVADSACLEEPCR